MFISHILVYFLVCLQFTVEDEPLHNFPLKDELVEISAGINGFMGSNARYTHYKAFNEDEENREIKYLYFIGRHGPRHSLSLKKISRLAEIFQTAYRRNGLRRTDLLNITQEFKKSESENIGLLTELAYTDIEKIGDYIFKYHKSFFNSVSKDHPLLFESSYKERSIQTMNLYRDKYIKLGMKEDQIIVNKNPPNCSSLASSLDYMKLRGFDACVRYQKSHRERSWANILHKIIRKEKGNLFEILLEKIFTTNYIKLIEDLYEPVNLIYYTCSMMNLISTERNEICPLLSKKLLRLLNFVADMDAYFDKGPQQPINFGFACPLLKDFLRVLESDFSKEKGTFLFGHNESLFPILSFFGFLNDISKVDESRTIRTAVMLPMSANIMMEVYKDETHEHVVRFLLNGKEIRINGCEKFCPKNQLISIIKEKMADHSLGTCTYDEVKRFCGKLECKEKSIN